MRRNSLQWSFWTEVSQLLLKPFTGKEYSAFDCSEREACGLGYLSVFVAGEVH